MTSRKIHTGVVAAALLALPLIAQAAELPQTSYKAPAYSLPSARSWAGFYGGINGGYGFGKSNWDTPAVSPSPKGALVGLTLGYNFQYNSWLLGVEGDWDFSTMKGSSVCGAGGNCETKNSWLGTVRGRVGYAFDNFLPYFTAGLGMGDIKATNTNLGTSASKTKMGLAIGAGLEYAMWTNWSVKLEYLYVDLGKFDCGISCGAATDNVSFNANVIRAGLNYRF
jgi:outer membrane immunogenic protein